MEAEKSSLISIITKLAGVGCCVAEGILSLTLMAAMDPLVRLMHKLTGFLEHLEKFAARLSD